jgi:hypothetical protein
LEITQETGRVLAPLDAQLAHATGVHAVGLAKMPRISKAR